MATVSKHLAMQIIDKNGYYSNDPRVMRIVEYTNMGGKLAYGLEYAHEVGKYTESQFIREPKVYWRAQ